MAQLTMAFLGGFRVALAGTQPVSFVSNKARALLAYLVSECERAHSREALIELLWPDYSQESAQSNLRNTLANLRDSIGDREAEPPYLLITRSSVQFNRAAQAQADLWSFRDNASDPRAAVDAYSGPFLQGFSLPDSIPFEDWLSRKRAVLAEQAQELLAALAEQAEACGDYPTALAWARRRLELEPWREEAHCQAMRALALLGQRAGALAQYESCVRALTEELAVEPDETTRALRELIAAGRLDVIRSGEPLPAPGEPPFKGLYYFDEADAGVFFGREHLVARLAQRIEQMAAGASPQLLAVVGASGSGKSSLVRAGLLPALKAGQQAVALCTPGAHPRLALTAMPAQGVWVIDQFEEVFTLCRQEEERSAFIEALLEKASAAPLVVVLRADFYANCAQYPRLREAISARQEYIGPMSAEELRRAVEAPAARGGWSYEAGLVELILRDVGNEPGALPLLQHALLETWQRRRGRQLTLTGYAEAGGVHGAIARTAEQVYGALGQAEQALARRIFLRLTELGEGAQDTRRRAGVAELTGEQATASEVEALLERLAAARLVTLSEGAAEVAHEALIREWPALREWLTQDREGLRLQRHIAESTEAWERLARDENELYRGARLAQALEWAAQPHNGAALNRLEREFLAASQERAEREARATETARQRELDSARKLAEVEMQAARRLRLRARLLAGAFGLALVFVALALWQSIAAQRSATAAQQARLAADESASLAFARELAAQSSARLESEPDLSTLLALEAVRTLREKGLAVPYDVQQAVHDVANLSRLVWSHTIDSIPWFVEFSPDGAQLAYTDELGAINLLDAHTGAPLKSFGVVANEFVNRIAISPNGRHMAAGYGNNQVIIWDMASEQRLLTIQVVTGWGSAGAEYSPDGNFLLTSGEDWTGRIWDLRPWLAAGAPAGAVLTEPLYTLGCAWPSTVGASFSPDGQRLAATCLEDANVHIWDLQTGQVLKTISLAGYMVFDSAFSPDGTRLATSTFTNMIFIWDVAEGKEITRINSAGGGGLEYSPDGRLLAVAGVATNVFNADDGQLLFTLPGRSNTQFLDFAPDGQTLAVTSTHGSIALWDVTRAGRGELGAAARSPDLMFFHGSPDGEWLFEALTDGTLVLRATSDLQVKATQTLYSGTSFSGWFSQDGTRFISGEPDHPENAEGFPESAFNAVRVWDAKTWQMLAEIPAQVNHPGAFNLSADGKLAAIGMADNRVKVVEVASGKELASLPVSFDKFTYVEFSPDGNWLAAAGGVDWSGGGGRVALWNLSAGFDPLPAPKILNADIRLVQHVNFSPDSTHLAACGYDQHAEIWNLATGEQEMLLTGHNALIWVVHYAPDGRHLVTASTDNSVRVWDAASGAQVLTYRQTVPGLYYTANFTPDSQRIVAFGTAGNFYQYIFQDFDRLLEIVESRVVRDWLPQECRVYLHRETCPPSQ